ncbi:MAG: AAA family ATPase [Promethearchaeota archaeon]|jgi:RecA/RadA recombinase
MQDILLEFKTLLQSRMLISIYGKSGTGKTFLGLYLVGNLLTEKEPYHYQCVWIQASEFFPSKRLSQLFQKDLKKLRFLRNNIFITPLKKPFLSYQKQAVIISQIQHKTLPPELKVIVIDNISHHLRYEISKYESISEKVSVLNDFYENQLFPLIMYCQQEDIILILIHEVSYNPNLKKIVPFLHKLYKRIDSINVYLEKDLISENKILHLNYADYNNQFNYRIQNHGFQWIEPQL